MAIDDVIKVILNVFETTEDGSEDEFRLWLERILSSMSVSKPLEPDTLRKLHQVIKRSENFRLEGVRLDLFIEAYLVSKDCNWLPLIAIVALRQGSAITVSGDKITVYGVKQPITMHVSSHELLLLLVTAFSDQAKRLNLFEA